MSKISRNDKCPCGSGKKFKNCCIDVYDKTKNELIEMATKNYSKLWTNEKFDKMTNAEIFQKLGNLGITMDEDKFIKYSAKEISSEKLTKLIETEAGIKIEGVDADFPWRAMETLWKRITPAHPNIEMIYNDIYDGYDDFENDDMDAAIERWSKAWNAIIKLFAPITREYEYVNSHYDGFDIDLFDWTYDFIKLNALYAEEDETFNDQKTKILNEFVSSFPETRDDLIINIKLCIAKNFFESGQSAKAEAEFENIARAYPHQSQVYEVWADVYGTDSDCDDIKTDIKKAEVIVEKGLLTGLDDPNSLLAELLCLRDIRIEEEPKNRAKFSTELENAEKWKKKFKNSATSDKIKLFSEISKSGLVREMLHYIEIAPLFMDAVQSAINSEHHHELFEFFNELVENRRELYLIFPETINNFIVSYHIRKNEFDKALLTATNFCLEFYVNRVTFEKFVEIFLLQKKADNALTLINRIIEKHWSALDDDCRLQIALILFYHDLQNEYAGLKQGNILQQLKNFKNFELYGKILDIPKMDKELEMLRNTYQTPDEINKFCSNLEKKNKFQRESFFESITSSFAAFTFEKYGIDFPVSYFLWSRFIEFIEDRFENNYNEMPPDKLFNFSADYLKKKVKASSETVIYPFEYIAPIMAGGSFACEYFLKTGIIKAALHDRIIGFFKDAYKYAQTKYPEKIWALKFFNI